MHTGVKQILGYGLEPSYGSPVVPNLPLGIVTGGSIREGLAHYHFCGVDSLGVQSQDYGKLEHSGNCTFPAQSLMGLNYLIDRATGQQYSWTFDCGVSIAGVVLPRRMVGCKVGNLKLSASAETPLEVNMSWLAQATIDGVCQTYPVPETWPIWIPESMDLYVGPTLLTGLQNIEIEVNCNLKPKYLANSQAPTARALTHLNEGPLEISVNITTFERLGPALRALPSVGYPDNGLTPLHTVSGIDVILDLVDPCLGNYASISLLSCYQPEIVEPLTPVDAVEYQYSLTAGSIVISSSI
jgi:hypothetical protein